MEPSAIVAVYATVGTAADAEQIARTVVDEKLAACVNILGAVTSVYPWNGEICCGQEVSMLFKTTGAAARALVARIVELHDYDCPAVLVLPVMDGHEGFLQWVKMNVIDPETKNPC